MYQPLILQRLSKIVLPQITTEDNLIMINCTFHWGYVFFWVPLVWRTSKKHSFRHNFCFPQGTPRSKISFERTVTQTRGQVKGGDVFLAYLDGQTTPRALTQASIQDLGTGSYVLLLPGDTLLPGDQFGYQKTKGHQNFYLDVLKSHVMPEGR